MNTDCAKPSVAPKPRFVCHASLKRPPPLTPAARGPKPFIAPKPKVALELNGNDQIGGSNGGSLSFDEERETQNDPPKVLIETPPAEKLLHRFVLRSPQIDSWPAPPGPEDGEVTERAEDEEDDAIHRTDEGRRLSDGDPTKDAGALGAFWVGGTRRAAESREPVEMIDRDSAEDVDGGEAAADIDGLSVGDFSVNSVDEDAGCCSAGNQNMEEKPEKLPIKEDESESPTNQSQPPQEENGKDTDFNQVFLLEAKEEEEEESASDCGFTCNILKMRCGQKIKEKGEDLHNVCFEYFIPEGRKQAANGHAVVEGYSDQEPVYVSSDDIINRESMPMCDRAHQVPEGGLTEMYVKSTKCCGASVRSDEEGPKTDRSAPGLRGYNSGLLGDVLDHLDRQPRFRRVSTSGPTDTDTSLTSSRSDSQLLSPNDSDVFEDDVDGHIVPFLDDTTDTEQDIGDEPVYVEPGRSFRAQNGGFSHRKAAGFQFRSLSNCTTNNLDDLGAQFTQKTYMSGFGQPALSSSPMLGSVRHLSYSKPHYLSLYPRSLSMEGQDVPLGVYKDGSPRQRGALCSSDSFSRRLPLSTPTSVVEIPPPFELAYITKRPITKSSPSLLMEGDTPEKNRKKKSSIKRFLMLKFRWKTDSKPVVDVNSSSFKSSVQSNHRTSGNRLLDLDRRSVSSSPQLTATRSVCNQLSPDPPSPFLLYNESKRNRNSVAFLNRSVVRVESFEDRSRVPFIPLPLTKPRSISFPNTDTSDYENVPALSSDYENLQVPQRRPVRQSPLADFFDRPGRVLSAANETDGYVDMSSLPGFEKKTQSTEQEAESAYTEAYTVCSVQMESVCDGGREACVRDEDQGRTSEEEEGETDNNYDRQPDGRSRAFYIVKELVDTERSHVKALKLLQEDFRDAVGSSVGDDGEPALSDERLREILNELPDVYSLHGTILTELENRIRHWEDSQRIADIFLSRRAQFLVFTTYIGHYDRSMTLLDDSRQTSAAFAAVVQQFEEQRGERRVTIQLQLLQVIVRVAQYRMLLTDYLNNLSPDSKEYEDTQAAVAIVSDIADQVNDSLKHGENLLRLVNIEYSVHGQRDLLQPGRFFVKEGTLMKVSRKSRQPRHLFLMNDLLLYTYPQQDGKYRLKNTLTLTGLKVSKPMVENVQNALKIEGTDLSITLSASSFIEREDWFYTLSRTASEQSRGAAAFSGSAEARDSLRLSLGEKAPTLVPVSQVMMCMNCTSDFGLTLRRHHCHGCGRIVCRSCSRNRYPLKYMKDRMAKVCDHCYNELKKRGGDASGQRSPSLHRSTRPLSAVFQNIHPPNIWRHRKGTLYFNQVTVSEEGSISGSLQRSKKTRRNWKKLWFLLKDKVLYTYRAQEEPVASESLPLLGFTVKLHDKHEGDGETNVFQLYHKSTLFYSFKAEDNYTAQRWVNAMEEATVL